mmetsp:Transcript_20185/g.26197  ORF Transcript_20185/g.26197 Transcript_20185/m.26197 type:complete len:283 (-) Transcript_20185:56-904(-)
MVVPLITIILLAILWSVPLNLASFKRLYGFTKFCQAWSALDVFLISIIAAVVEIGGLSESVIGDAFGSIQETLCKLLKEMPEKILDDILHAVGLPSIDAELEECALFRVEAVLLEGCWMLLFGVISCAIATHLIMEFSEAAIQERLLVAKVFSKKGSELNDDEVMDPYVMFRQSAPVEVSETLSPRFHRAGSFEDIADSRKVASLHAIIKAQEEGGKMFLGSYFGDGMYGPFPRAWWNRFCSIKLVYKVDWDKTGFDLHAALLMNRLLHQEESEHRVLEIDR